MSVREALMRALIQDDNPSSLAAKARRRRWQLFASYFPDFPDFHVLDLGGRPEFWRQMDKPPASVTVVNLEDTTANEAWITTVRGDACNPPREVQSRQFDLIFSNSLIEHLGGIANRQRCSDFIRGAADRYWVQTPYRYFPLEPHWVFPGFQFLPLSVRTSVTQRWPLGHMQRQDRAQAVAEASWVELVSITEMHTLYPDGEILFERFAGLVKSLIAVRANRGDTIP